MNKTRKRGLSFRHETIRTLGDLHLRDAAGGMPPLSFGTGCPTANCMTLGELCNPTNNCLTLGPYCISR